METPENNPEDQKLTIEQFLAPLNGGRKRNGKFRPGTPNARAFALGLKRRRFWEMVQTPDWHCLSTKEKAEVLEVTTVTVRNWENALSDEEWKKALETSRNRHAKTSLKVDAAVVKESLNGNVKASELFYRRIEGWAPKSGMELTRGADGDLDEKGDRELLVGLLASLTPEERRSLLQDAENAKFEAPPEPGKALMDLKQPDEQNNPE